MTRLQHLTALRDKVKAGQCSHGTFADELINDSPNDGECVQQAIWAHHAYHGSLDAAKALHEALFPGWVWSVSTNTVEGSADAQAVVASEWQDASAFDDSPARAWLLAILKALIAQEGGE